MLRIFFCLVLGLASARAVTFSFTLSSPAVCSAGIYNASNQLIKTVFADESLGAGAHTVNWDGTTDMLGVAAAGSYTWKVAVNGNIYSQGVQVGNTGVPTTTSGHVPSFIEGISLDSVGNVYSVNGFDEAHWDVIEWRASDGHAIKNTGHPFGDILLEGVAVTPDGARAYVTGLDKAVTDPAHKTHISSLDIASRYGEPNGYGLDSLKVQWTGLGSDRLVVHSGAQSWPGGFSDADKATASIPIRSLALLGNTLYAPDSLGQRVLRYDATTGLTASGGHITNVPVACGIAVDAATGNIWVGSGHTSVRVYSPAGSLLGTPVLGLTEVRSIAISGTTMYVADFGTSQIRKYTISGATAALQGTFGSAMVPGDRAFNKLMEIRAVGADEQGNLFIADRPGDGGRLQKINPAMDTQIWEQLCGEFSAVASYSSGSPNQLISSIGRAYQIDRSNGTWTYSGLTRIEGPTYFGHFVKTDEGPPRVRTFGGKDFFYFPSKDGIGVYRVLPAASGSVGPTTQLASLISRDHPLPDGTLPVPGHEPASDYYILWQWNDGMSAHPSISNEIFSPPSGNSEMEIGSFSVDPAGDLWLAAVDVYVPPAEWFKSSIWRIPRNGFTPAGSPIYRWNDMVQLFTRAQASTMLGIPIDEFYEWKRVDHADGKIYGLGITIKAGAPQYPDLHPGGNVLAAFQGPGPFSAPLWNIILPDVAAGLAAIPGGGGGVMIGGDPDFGGIYHYAQDGLLIKRFYPGVNLSGSFGTTYGRDWIHGRLDSIQCVQAERGPTNKIDVFVQDNVNQRIIWYEVEDGHVTYPFTGSISAPSGNTGAHYPLTVNGGLGTGSYLAGETVTITADPVPVRKTFGGWVGSGVTPANPSSAATTLTMPAAAASVTATYSWVTGPDTVRFAPHDPNHLVGAIFEGANDPAGPWTTFYDIPTAPSMGLQSVSVDTLNSRYLRMRIPEPHLGNGTLKELDFLRGGTRPRGTWFGTPTINEVLLWTYAFDGLVNSDYVEWDDYPYPGPTMTFDTGATAGQVRIYARTGFAGRVDGATIEAANSSVGPWYIIYVMPVGTAAGWNVIDVGIGNFTNYRYRAPRSSYGNVAEVEFWRGGQKLTGTAYGTAGSFGGSGNTYDKAFDGDTSTFFDAPQGDDVFLGLMLNPCQ